MIVFASLLAGLVFGIGLILSGMANPAKVLGFLDLAGAWDPSLAFVMAGALAVPVPGFAFMRRRGHSLLGEALAGSSSGPLDRRLLAGAAIFGLGWGLQGYCPGPAVVAFGMLQWPALLFLPAMLAGAWLADRFRSV